MNKLLLLLLLVSPLSFGETLTTQSKSPWSISQCDRVRGKRAKTVVNISVFNFGGWPLWRVVCTY